MIASKVHEIWSRALKTDEFADDDEFFVLGGNSLAMTRIQREIQAELGVAVPMDELFRRTTVVEVTEYIEAVLAAA
ncbi:acyl carrier protein [Streptomyces sp. ISL-66]|uniref:acyl carrier protein n=1 Tax=Streptomyces sp. ISL-66 TaxID=2819186 RepID=UPI001BE514F2|nr:acyl carrier protein [Streptomyces sp. ISL-66]MBT2470899.1 acyl carrier protein [Streptomyces sp. ISL-66]